jgi:hypothetical protein
MIKKVFARENIVSILIMVGGLIVITNNFFDFFSLSETQKILLSLTSVLAMLTLLGIDGFIEKISFFGKLQIQIDEINSKIEPDPSHIFKRRVSKPPFDTLVQDHDTIWLSGTSLVNILRHYGNHIQQFANNGKQFKFLITNPDNPTLLKIFSKSSPSDETIPELKIRGHQAIGIIQRLQKDTPKGSIEAKIVDYLFAQSYFILDGDKPNGVIHIEMYGYKIATGDKLTLTLKCKDNNSSYAHHVEQFKKMWNDAKSL